MAGSQPVGPRMMQALALADGTRTFDDIASAMGVSRKTVHVYAHKLRRAGYQPVIHGSAHAVEMDAFAESMPPQIRDWLRSSTPIGATVEDAIRAIVTDAYFEAVQP